MATAPAKPGSPFTVLRTIAMNRPARPEGLRCEMCAEPIAEQHQHAVDLESRAMLCVCRPCYLLFTDSTAQLRYRSVPDRYLSFPDFELGQGNWDELEIPVNLAFFFQNSRLGRSVAFYPGPAGATESELPLEAWATALNRNPELATAAPDTEALLIRVPGKDGTVEDCHLVPIDTCYELVGQLRRVWRGFDGGKESRDELKSFFGMLEARSRSYPREGAGRSG